MSTIIATTLSNGSVSVPTATVVNGSAKAWVNFNGTSTIAARDSFNVASLTDGGTGIYTIGWTAAMGNANYAFLGTSGASASYYLFVSPNSAGTKTTSAYRIDVIRNDVGNYDDPTYVNAAIHGDLA